MQRRELKHFAECQTHSPDRYPTSTFSKLRQASSHALWSVIETTPPDRDNPRSRSEDRGLVKQVVSLTSTVEPNRLNSMKAGNPAMW